MAENDNKLSRDDLFLLLESYKNTIQLNTTLCEQQKQILNKQNLVCDSITKILNEIKYLVKINTEIDYKGNQKLVVDGIGNVKDKVDDVNNTVKLEFSTHKMDVIKDHSGITIKLYIAFGGMISIIITLIGIIMYLSKLKGV